MSVFIVLFALYMLQYRKRRIMRRQTGNVNAHLFSLH